MFWPLDQRAAWDLELKLHTARTHISTRERASEERNRLAAVAARVHNMQSGEPLNLKFNHSVSNSNCAAAELMEMRAMVLDAGGSATTTTPLF
jgi:hypothetical protein